MVPSGFLPVLPGRTGMVTLSATMPTKPAVLVPTPAMGLMPDGTSST
jgi:hypothetical protein